MADIIANDLAGNDQKRRFRDQSDGTYAEVVALGVEAPITLTGDLVVDTLGALNNAKVTNPDAASATIPALLRGILAEADVLGSLAGAKVTDPDAASATVAALLRGILAELQAHTALLTTIAANTA